MNLNHIISVLVMLFISSCSLIQSDMESVSDILPRDTDLSGWIRKSPPAEYAGSSVKKYRKDYGNIGIERLSVCSFESLDEDKSIITVEAVKFDSMLNAYGFFSRTAGGREFSTSSINELYTDAEAVVLRGEFIIHVFTDSAYEDMENILKSFTRSALKYLGSDFSRGELAGTINVLKNRDKYGIIYSVMPPEQFEGISNIYFTLWRYGDNPLTIFLSERGSFQDSYRIFRSRIKNGYILAESGTVHTAFKKEKDGTYTFISVYDKWLYGCGRSPDIETGKKASGEINLKIMQNISRQNDGYRKHN